MSRWEGLEEVVAIADSGSFVGAARKLDESTSHVSRVVARLEARLETRLIERTTRAVRLTEAGRTLVEHFRHLIEGRDEALRLVREQNLMQGEIRVTTSIALGERFVAPVVREFLERYDGIAVTLELSNRVFDIVREGFDVAIRTGHPGDGRLAGRQIAARSVVVCASPAYLAVHGTPSHPDDLARHACLIGTSPTWHFSESGRHLSFVPEGRFRCNNGFAVVDAALAGMGICQLPTYYVATYLETGRLVPLLQEFREVPEPIWSVYQPHRYFVPKIRNFIDLLETRLGEMVS